MFSNAEVIVAQIVMTQYVVASLSRSVISDATNLLKLTNLPKLMIKYQKQKLFKDTSRRFLR